LIPSRRVYAYRESEYARRAFRNRTAAGFDKLAERNPRGATSFLGAGAYQHYIPHGVESHHSRSEFFTATRRINRNFAGHASGNLRIQTLVCNHWLEVANASMYDGSTALAEAVLMANE